ncbi:MAG: amidohydrolase family protein, partial [Phycisphaerae bacterium]
PGPGKGVHRGATIDAAGGLVLPSLFDNHLHLDLAHSVDAVPENRSGTLLEAIGLWARAKAKMSPQNVCERAMRAIGEEVAFGTGYIRNHVDVGSTAGLRLCEGVLAARERMTDRVDIRLVTFPQDGVVRDPGAIDRMREALRMGCDLVGGIPHFERTYQDSCRQIDMIFDLAEELDCDIDCHIDETDAPESRCVEYLAAQTIERGWQGRVSASHVCALASYTDAHAKRVIDSLAEARITVVTNPQVNLHLQGRFDTYPKRRGLTRVRQCLAAGVNVAMGQDCIRDPFYPFGTGAMLDVAHTLVHADHLATPKQVEAVADILTVNAAKSWHLNDYGVARGKVADLIILPVDSIHEAIRLRPRPTAVLKHGKPV